MTNMKLVLNRYDFSRIVSGFLSAPVILPVGSKIVKVTYNHVGTGSPHSSLRIMRVKTGETPEKLGNGSSTDATGKRIPVNVPITGDPIIKTAYRYYALVSISWAGYFEGVKILYRE